MGRTQIAQITRREGDNTITENERMTTEIDEGTIKSRELLSPITKNTKSR